MSFLNLNCSMSRFGFLIIMLQRCMTLENRQEWMCAFWTLIVLYILPVKYVCRQPGCWLSSKNMHSIVTDMCQISKGIIGRWHWIGKSALVKALAYCLMGFCNEVKLGEQTGWSFHCWFWGWVGFKNLI